MQDEVLEHLAGAVNYRRWFVELALPWLGPEPLEIGAGRGDHAAELLAAGCRVTVAESDPKRLAELDRRFADSEVRTISLTLPGRPGRPYTGAVAMNVLEHIADDAGALASMAEAVVPGGHVVVIVPAFPSAMSDFDRAIGHHRRYRRRDLAQLASTAELEVVQLRYLNPIGLIAWYVLVRLMGRTPSDGPLLRAFDRLVVPISRKLETKWSAPFGQSLLLVGRRSNPPQ